MDDLVRVIRQVHRVALYYAPAPATAWHAFGSAWLGRDAVSGQAPAQPEVPVTGGLYPLTVDARRYGFHATLKAPFRLAAPQGLEALKAALEEFSQGQVPVPIGPLTPTWMEGGYVALLPALAAREAINTFAARIVQAFDVFRAPLSESELARRHPEKLSARQNALLAQYGYPYVLDEFQFHMTLSDQVDGNSAAALTLAAATPIERLNRAPPLLDAITLFIEPEPGAPFIALRRYPLHG